jgi:hypothetical protein
VADEILDLFGMPILAAKGKGRPEHVWTVENSNKVNLLFACEKKATEIAHTLGISKPTFYKHYFNEIARAGQAPLMLTGLQLERLNAEADKGNVAAIKALNVMIEREQMRSAEGRVRDRGKGEPKPAPLGKKEQAKVDAATAGGRFATRSAPERMIN